PRAPLRRAALAGSDRSLAAKPVTAGQAIDVPLMTPQPPGTEEMTPTPGPVTSISAPTLENAAMKSFLSLPYGGATSPDSVVPAGNVLFRPQADTATLSW